MIRTNLIPQNTDIRIKVPESYLGKQVEVLLYTLEEITDTEKPAYTLSDLWGKLSDESAQKLRESVEEIRTEWDVNT